MLLHESRRAARATSSGDLILLEDQDRSLWNRDQIDGGHVVSGAGAGVAPVRALTPSRRRSPPSMPTQPARPPPTGPRSWRCTICYCELNPRPVVELNRAVAVAMRDGAEAGLVLVDAILARGDLSDYRLAHAARADLCRRLGQVAEPAPPTNGH